MLRICTRCGIDSDSIKFAKGRNKCRPCYNEYNAKLQRKAYREHREEIREKKNAYREKVREEHNRKERERYRKKHNLSALSHRKNVYSGGLVL